MESLVREVDSSCKNDAIARTTAYLCGLGLPADHAAEQAIALFEQCDSPDDALGVDTVVAALTRVTSEYDAWLTYLSRNGDGTAVCRPGLLAWPLGAVLARDPDSFLRRGHDSELVRLAIQAAAQPAVPEEMPAPMPAQSLGGSLAVFRRNLWHSLAEWFVGVQVWLSGGRQER